MKAAESTLTAAMTRARAVRPGPGLHGGEGRHDEEAAGDREAGEVDRDAQAVGRSAKNAPRADRRHRAGAACADRPGEVEPEQRP